MALPDDVQILLDKQEIREVVMRYCRGIDRLDFDLVRSAYHADGIDHHAGFSGTVDEFIAWVAPLLRLLEGTSHTVGNHLAEVRGDVAVSETYCLAAHWASPASEPRGNFTTGIRYVDHMERRDGRWAIVERFAIREWTHSDAPVRIEPELIGPRSHRDGNDPVFELTRRLLTDQQPS